MSSQKGQSDLFTIVCILTLVFVVLGIAVGVIQWRSYGRTPVLGAVAPVTADEGPSLDTEDAAGATAAEAPPPGAGGAAGGPEPTPEPEAGKKDTGDAEPKPPADGDVRPEFD